MLQNQELECSRPSKSAVAFYDRYLTAFGCVLFACGCAIASNKFFSPISVYDEGHLLTDAQLVLEGKVPHRDFYTNYPPGVFWLTAFLWKITGPSILAARAAALAVQLLVVLMAGCIAGRLRGRRFSWLAFGASFLWWRHVPHWPSGYCVAVGLALSAILIYTGGQRQTTRLRAMAGGTALGLASLFRHDFCIYFAIALAVSHVTASWLRRSDPAPTHAPRRNSMAIAGVAAGLVALTGFGWLLSRAGFSIPFRDLYLDQVRYMVPARSRPIPPMWRPQAVQVGLMLIWTMPAIALIAMRSRKSDLITGLLALSLAVVPQSISRVDLPHVAYSVLPAIIIGTSLALDLALHVRQAYCRRIAFGCIILFIGLAGFYRSRFFPIAEWTHIDNPRYEGLPESTRARAADRAEVLAFIADNTSSEDTIFVGTEQHDRIYINEMDLYFLANRRGATRIMQFEPNIVDRDDVQEAMIRDFDANGLAACILSKGIYREEPGYRSTGGSHRLDQWLQEQWQLALENSSYRVLVRR